MVEIILLTERVDGGDNGAMAMKMVMVMVLIG